MAGDDTAPPHGKFGLGRTALPEEITAWTKEIMPDGRNLPEGSGSVEDGEMLFSENCAVCHGEFAEGVDNWPKLAGGMGTLNRDDPLKTVGSFWPHLSTTYDYVRRSMPFGAAQTMSDDDVYALVAYIVYSNDLVEDDFVLSKETFLDVEMPNADGFFVDDRDATEYGKFSQAPCMENCKDSVEITMRAAVLDVTPDHGGSDVVVDAAAMQGMDAGAETATPAAEPEAMPEAAAVVAVAEAPNTDVVAPEAAAAPAAAMTMAQDPELVAAGAKVFKKCQACHAVGEGAKNKVGPVLTGLVGRTAGTEEGFRYSPAMTDAGGGGLVWNETTISEYLADPKAYIKGNKMAFAGLKKDDEIKAVIAFIESNS
nr:c-type cytochrome [Tropicimonas sp. IMCC34043]